MTRIQWWQRLAVGISVIAVFLFGVAVDTSIAQGQRFVVFEAFFSPG